MESAIELFDPDNFDPELLEKMALEAEEDAFKMLCCCRR